MVKLSNYGFHVIGEERMPTTEARALAVVAIVKDLLHALHLPGAETLGALVEKEIEDRKKATFDMLLQELQKARDEGVTFQENDVHDFAQMVLRLDDAVSKGTARRNLRLMSQVIVGLKRNRLFEFNDFQRWANVLETLTRDEILVLGTAYRLKKTGVQDLWAGLKETLVPEPFKTNVDLEAVCAALARTGLVLPASAWGGMVYLFNDGVVQLGELADLENATGHQRDTRAAPIS
jgi:hypothetical protein